jgi:hypothetical protein
MTDATAHAVPRVGTHSMGRASGSVSQRNGGVGGNLTFSTYAPPGLRGYVRIPIELTSLKPEAARSLFPRLIDRNHHFWRLMTLPRISTRRTISTASARVRDACLRRCARRGCAVRCLPRSYSAFRFLPNRKRARACGRVARKAFAGKRSILRPDTRRRSFERVARQFSPRLQQFESGRNLA